MYRGHANESWDLLPTAHRHTSSESGFFQGTRYRIHSQTDDLAMWMQINRRDCIPDGVCKAFASARAELSLLSDFATYSNDVGHHLPDPRKTPDPFEVNWRTDIKKFPLVRFYPEPFTVMAIAQHHGLPTRLLDFTHRSEVAALFAASGVASRVGGGKLCVWGFDKNVLRQVDPVDGDPGYMVYEVPKSTDKFLHAQSGVFLHAKNACAFMSAKNRWPTLLDELARLPINQQRKCLRKFTLPHAQAGELLRRLSIGGLTKAHLMPTFDSVVETLNSQWKWINPLGP